MGSLFSSANSKQSETLEENTGLADWMRDTFSQKSNISLIHIILPGTHDSATSLLTRKTLCQNLSPSSMIRKLPPTSAFQSLLINMARTQRPLYGLVAQLQQGVRFFDIRLLWTQKDVPFFRHGDIVFRGNVLDEFRAVANFIANHPQEFIFFKFSHFSFLNRSSAPDDVIIKFARNLVDALGESRIATIEDQVTAQTYKTQVLEQGRNVVVVFDVRGDWMNSRECPPQIIPSTNFWITRYDPSVGNSLQRLLRSAHLAVEEYENLQMNVFKNVQLHYQYDTKTFSRQALIKGQLSVQPPPNKTVIEQFVIPLSTTNLSLNILTFDFYTSELTPLIIQANELRLETLGYLKKDE